MNTPKYQVWHKREKKMQQVLQMIMDSERGGVLVWEESENTQYWWPWNFIELRVYIGRCDKNGVGVYEGDIVRGETVDNNGNRKLWEIFWHKEFLGFYAREMDEPRSIQNLLSDGNVGVYEVVGNIYEGVKV